MRFSPKIIIKNLFCYGPIKINQISRQIYALTKTYVFESPSVPVCILRCLSVFRSWRSQSVPVCMFVGVWVPTQWTSGSARPRVFRLHPAAGRSNAKGKLLSPPQWTAGTASFSSRLAGQPEALSDELKFLAASARLLKILSPAVNKFCFKVKILKNKLHIRNQRPKINKIIA